jgi:membrane-bound metal-dependent hydrolase YbcI (DUF457 family)
VKYHHQLTHNFVFAALVAVVSARWIGLRPWQLLRVFFCVLTHFLGDYYGSGPGWVLPLFYPFADDLFVNPVPWKFNGWQSQIVFALALVATVVIARRCGRTPLESISTGLDTMLADLAFLGFSSRCECGKRAVYRCHECRVVRCSGHVRLPGYGRVLCESCFDRGRESG